MKQKLALKEIKLLSLSLSAVFSALVISAWYIMNRGGVFAEEYHFCGIDALFSVFGNYPEEVDTRFLWDHYLLILLPFIILIKHIISYIQVNTCDILYYLCLRRSNVHKQFVIDVMRIAVSIFWYMFVLVIMMEMILGYLYGWSGQSYFIGTSITYWGTVLLLFQYVLRQCVILCVVSIAVYIIQLRYNGIWAAIIGISCIGIFVLLDLKEAPNIIHFVSVKCNIIGMISMILILILYLLSYRKKFMKLYFKEY